MSGSSPAHPQPAALAHPPGGPLSADPDTADARRAASVLVLRDTDDGPEVLLLRRAERHGDQRSGIWVFPGGVLDPVDPTLHRHALRPEPALADARLDLGSGALDYWAAAVRECFEEVGLLFAQPADPARPEALAAARREQSAMASGADFDALCQRHGLALDYAALRYCAHWLTPPGLPKRFDTRFFIARLPAGQAPVADEGEAQEIAWMRPQQALDRARELKLLPVTVRCLQDLLPHRSVQAALDAAAALRVVERQMPRLATTAQGVRPVLPQSPAWAEVGRLDPTGQGHVWAELRPGQVVTLSPRVQRITCDNGSVMTGPGTNTYLLRSPGSDEVAVLDPGPDDAGTEAHLQAVLAAAAPGRITRILVTHTHKDHSPAARRLQALTGARLIGRVADHPMWQDTDFQPDDVPADGARLALGPDCTLQAVHTPGHASNHVCWWLLEEALLFTGDHVMQGSTVVINPPDGDMAAYLRALRHLASLPLAWLAPGHGFLMAKPVQVLKGLVAHRLGREAKVLAALAQLAPTGQPVSGEALLPVVYGDVPAARHGIALRSMWAHLLKLVGDGRVRAVHDAATLPADGGCWQAVV